jgi:protein phosphatase
LVRSSNQDAFAVLDHLGLWIVADGMGGHAGGDVASRLAVDAVAAEWPLSGGAPHGHDAGDAGQLDPADPALPMRRTIAAANHTILREASRRPELTGMGTTLVALRIIPDPPARAIVAHVGDSRAYAVRGRAITRLTRDHSWVEEQVRAGLLSPAEALSHPWRHVLSRALGTEEQVEPDITVYQLEPEDRVILCTDGLTKMLDDDQILEQVLAGGGSGQEACQILVHEANRRGGYDNVTVVIVQSAVLS